MPRSDQQNFYGLRDSPRALLQSKNNGVAHPLIIAMDSLVDSIKVLSIKQPTWLLYPFIFLQEVDWAMNKANAISRIDELHLVKPFRKTFAS